MTALSAALGAGAAVLDPETYVLLREYVRDRTGILYGDSRRAIFASRVMSRVAALELPDANAYVQYLRFHPARDQEFLELVSVLTNNETYFLREAKVLDAIVEELSRRLERPGRVRVLSAGASSGEELASLAMLLKEAGVDLDRLDLQGVDIDVRMVQTAKEGLYRNKSFRNMDAERTVRFFTPEGEGRRLKPAVRNHLSFRWANLVDPATLRFPHAFDVVFVRNVLIYFDAETVRRVARTLHGLLADEGVLAIGVSESLAHVPFLFDPERTNGAVVYRKAPL